MLVFSAQDGKKTHRTFVSHKQVSELDGMERENIWMHKKREGDKDMLWAHQVLHGSLRAVRKTSDIKKALDVM